MKYVLLGASALVLVACGGSETATTDTKTDDHAVVEHVETSAEKLDAALAAQSDETKARYQFRHPAQTLSFFGVEPGMTVVDTLPGKPGWYAPILKAYLGSEGTLVGADYSMDMWPLFGGFADEAWIEERKGWPTDYVTSVNELEGEGGSPATAFTYGSLPEDMHGSADVVMMVRAAHHFNRFESQGGFFTSALGDIQAILKPGGILGIVQHRSPEGNADDWANGDNGYVKQSHIISFVEAAGFEFIEASEANANSLDVPSEEDAVWRLPPTLGVPEEQAEVRAQMEAIGESDRMTLKFRKAE